MSDYASEERVLVLKMLQEGTISVEESIRLLEALKQPADSVGKDREIDDKLNKFSSSMESFIKEFGQKIEVTFKDIEPRLKKATKSVVEKTATVVDDISKSLNETIRSMEANIVETQDQNDGESSVEVTPEEQTEEESREN